jgi:hypothetical protein
MLSDISALGRHIATGPDAASSHLEAQESVLADVGRIVAQVL